ncbi:hypothetical protein NBO_12g0013 [Nosema bombycis CQ1]|uniref:Uncharacterized protein n=1 Tax=Nosema bombycis (strain CQ1 / CVCC 102059) TaxID=578461 RepID=R0KXI8_NOSB1|nr:hypothetical protein NBO_12g0013 [Nosema bombycis CQ1]|eukprot:EOB14907.1 hypothetical protein NBO_12g0013 [Nosema bombycis CQ1]
MNLFSSVIVLISNIGCASDYFSINEILMYENNYWGENRSQVITDKGFLEHVTLKIVDKKCSSHSSKCFLSDCHYDIVKNKYYFILCPCHSIYIFSNLNKAETVIFRSTYTFLNNAFVKLSNYGREKKYRYDNFKILIKDSSDIFRLENDDLVAYQSHIKQIFSNFISSGFIIEENFESVLEKDFIDTTPKFVLYHFVSLSSCLESYKEFMKYCNFLNLVDDNKSLTFNFKVKTNSDNMFRASKLKEYLEYHFKIYCKRKMQNPRFIKLKSWIDHFFKECCYKLEENILDNKIVLPFYEADSLSKYFNRFYGFIENVLDDFLENFEPLSLDFKKNYHSYVSKFLKKIDEMSKEFVNNSWDLLNVTNIFSKMFKRDLKDFIEIDKLMCDFHNMICCVSATRDGLSFSELKFKHPRFKDNYECRIIKGIEIVFDFSKNESEMKLNKPVLFQAVKALDREDHIHYLENNVDYFVRFLEDGFSLRFTLVENKRKKN